MIYVKATIVGLVASVIAIIVYGAVINALYHPQGMIAVSLLAPQTLVIIAVGFSIGFLSVVGLFR